jgi:hypothetical protein
LRSVVNPKLVVDKLKRNKNVKVLGGAIRAMSGLMIGLQDAMDAKSQGETNV